MEIGLYFSGSSGSSFLYIGQFFCILVTIAFLSLQGYVLFFKNSLYRNVRCVYISLQPSFNAQAGILDGPGAFRQFKLCFFHFQLM